MLSQPLAGSCTPASSAWLRPSTPSPSVAPTPTWILALSEVGVSRTPCPVIVDKLPPSAILSACTTISPAEEATATPLFMLATPLVLVELSVISPPLLRLPLTVRSPL